MGAVFDHIKEMVEGSSLLSIIWVRSICIMNHYSVWYFSILLHYCIAYTHSPLAQMQLLHSYSFTLPLKL